MAAIGNFFTTGNTGSGNIADVKVEDPTEKIKKELQKIVDDAGKPIMKEIDNIKSKADGITNQIKNGFTKIIDDIKNFVIDKIWNPIDRQLIQPVTRFIQTIIDHINCGIDKIKNFAGCFFWYCVYIAQETGHLIMVGVFTLLNMLTGSDLLRIYYMMLDYWGMASAKCLEYTGFELFIFPYSNEINNKCFTCDQKKSGPTRIATLTKDLKDNIKNKTVQFRNFTKNLADSI
jgi:hypothetical protein